MLKKLEKFTTLTRQQKSVFIQAWFMLAWFRAAILCVSFKRLARKLEHHRLPPQSQTLTSEQLELAASIGKLVATAARFTPWQSRCLVQVLVTQRLLARHNIGGQFYLGVRKGSEDCSSDNGLSAHAWLQCDSEIVNGASGHEAFAVVSSFSWQ
jgi:hypothetical protein